MDRMRWWRGFLVWAAIGAVVFLAVSLVCAFRIDVRFKRDGRETMGVVTRIYSKVETRSRRVSRRVTRREKVTLFYLDYRFSVDGRDYDGVRFPQGRFDRGSLLARRSVPQPVGARRREKFQSEKSAETQAWAEARFAAAGKRVRGDSGISGAFRDAESSRTQHFGNFFLQETVIFRRAVCRLNIFSYLCAPVICGERITTS